MSPMAREISAGGIVLREISGVWHVALIEPQRSEDQNTLRPGKFSRRRRTGLLSLPKGLVDAGEKAEAAALREVYEETGLRAEVIEKLADIKYVYQRSWSDGERVFKIVSFYLMRYLSGEIDDVTPEMRIEVKRALWVPVMESPSQMAHSSERKLVEQAWQHVEADGLAVSKIPSSAQKPLSGHHTDT